MQVLVIGAGIVGASVAFRLRQAGAVVTLVDQGRPGGGTTSTSFAWINASAKPVGPYQDLNAEGVRAHRRLQAALGEEADAPRWLFDSGHVRCASGAEATALPAQVEQLRAAGYPAELLRREQAEALEPTVQWPRDQRLAFAHFLSEGWVHGPTLVRLLVAAVEAAGGTVLAGDGVVALAADGTSWQARLASGRTLQAERVVIAAGRWSDRVAALTGVQVPLAPTCGLLAVTEGVEGGPRGVVHLPDVHFRPDGDGRIVLQAGDIDATMTPDTPGDPALPGCAELLRRARHYLPALAGVRVEEARVGIRALPADGFPLVGPLEGRPGLYLVVTHSGITLGALLGELVAAEVARGDVAAALVSFRPDRCVRVVHDAG